MVGRRWGFRERRVALIGNWLVLPRLDTPFPSSTNANTLIEVAFCY